MIRAEEDSWLGEPPITWSTRRLDTLGTFFKGGGGSKEDDVESGVPVVRYGELYTKFDRVITEARSFISESTSSKYTPLPRGSIVFAGSGEDPEDIGKCAVSLLNPPAYVGGDTVVFRPSSPDVNPLFLAYYLESHPLKALKAIRSTGFTVVHISSGKLKTLPVLLPPRRDQQQIAAFLDRETAQIDALIAQQELFIAHARERRAAVLEAAVAAPAGSRDVRALGSALERVDLRLPGVDLPLMSVSQTVGVVRRSSLTDTPPRAESLDAYKVCREGQLVFNKMKVRAGAIGVAPEDGLVTYHYEVMRVRPTADPAYLVYLMKSRALTAELVRRERGLSAGDESSRVRTTEVPFRILRGIQAHLPPVARQKEIVARLQHELTAADRLIAAIEEHITLAKERRAALITAAVTGRIDVTRTVN